jgi:glycerate 2-kinase
VDTKSVASDIFLDAIKSVQPEVIFNSLVTWENDHFTIGSNTYHLPPESNLFVIAVGKASCAMSQAIEKMMGHRIHKGLCITKKGHNLPLHYFKIIESGHPVPDDQSFEAGVAVEHLLAEVNKNDLVLVLLSGGASSLMMDCPAGLCKNDIQRVYDILLKSGADIAEMNLIRTALSTLKGGGMSKLVYPSTVLTLAISDVCGDHPEVIGSGPTVIQKTDHTALQKIIDTYELNTLLPAAVLKYLKEVARNPLENQTYKDQIRDYYILANNEKALEGASQCALKNGLYSYIQGKNMSIDTDKWGLLIFNEIQQYSGSLPACLLWGGESVLTVTGNGKGGRNQHLLLSLMFLLKSTEIKKKYTIICAGTDGSDGATDATGAMISNEDVCKTNLAEMAGYLKTFDSYTFFDQYHCLIKTGPTQTNVMDLVLVVLDE